MTPDSKIFIAGHRGMVGAALQRCLQAAGYHNIITRNRMQLDLLDQRAASEFVEFHRPEVLLLCAARDPGIGVRAAAPASLLYENLTIASHLIHAAHEAGVKQLLFFGHPCVYPAAVSTPQAEEAVGCGATDPASTALAAAKLAAMQLCAAYRQQYGHAYLSVIPASLYGPGARFDADSGHALPALMRRAHEAREAGAASLPVWGDGAALRDFLHVDDLAAACVLLLEQGWNAQPWINVGSGQATRMDAAVAELCGAMEWAAAAQFDPAAPRGPAARLLEVSRIHALGWQARIPLAQGLRSTYAAFVEGGAGRRKKKKAA